MERHLLDWRVDGSIGGDALDKIFLVDWVEMFTPTHSLAEIAIRGTIMYLALLLILRFVMLRQSSSLALADILVIVVIADAAQNGFAKEYKSITEGILLVLTIVCWDLLLNILSYRFRWFEKIWSSAPINLVNHGQMVRRNMRREFVTEDELMAQLRLQGVQDLSEVERVCLEGNGDISVVKKESGGGSKKRRAGIV